jgi:hypothetical protein
MKAPAGALLALALALATALPACRKAAAPPAQAREIAVGVHRLLVRLPAGWQVYDQGEEIVVKAPPLTDAEYKTWDRTGRAPGKGNGSVRIRDLGAAAAEGNPAPPLSDFATRALAKLGHDQRRDIEFRRPLLFDGREAEEIGTWQRATHTMPQRLLFVLDDGAVLAIASEPLGGEESLSGYEAIRGSLQFGVGPDSARR